MSLIKKILKTSVYDYYWKVKSKKIEIEKFKNQKKNIATYLSENQTRKLQIGCGSNMLESWLNSDLNYSEKVTFLDAGKIFPIASNTFDAVYSEHLFEHLTVEQQLNMLKESFRILKKNGVLRIATPSIKFLFDLYHHPNEIDNINYVGWAVKNIPKLVIVDEQIQAKESHYCYVINNFFKAWGHQMIHNFGSLKNLGMQIGFEDCKGQKVGESEFNHLQNIEKHGTIIPSEFNLLETMVVEFKKL